MALPENIAVRATGLNCALESQARKAIWMERAEKEHLLEKVPFLFVCNIKLSYVCTKGRKPSQLGEIKAIHRFEVLVKRKKDRF